MKRRPLTLALLSLLLLLGWEAAAQSPAPALEFWLHPGASVEVGSYSHRREVIVVGARDGLSRWSLDAEDMAVARPDLRDLRVVDGEGRAWPHLLEAGEPVVEPVTIAAAMRGDGETRYRFALSASPITLSRVELDVVEGYVDRPFRLVARQHESPITVAAGNLRRRPGNREPLGIALDRERVEALTLVVEDGDDAPLSLRGARIERPSNEVYLAAPDGRYWLMLGSPQAEAARYEMMHARDLVLSIPASGVELGALEANPDRVRHADPQHHDAIMWLSLLGAVVVLTLLTFRLAARDTAREPDGDGDWASPPDSGKLET